jgi:hypothetical protein
MPLLLKLAVAIIMQTAAVSLGTFVGVRFALKAHKGDR